MKASNKKDKKEKTPVVSVPDQALVVEDMDATAMENPEMEDPDMDDPGRTSPVMESPEDEEVPEPIVVGATSLPEYTSSQTSLPNDYDDSSSDEDEEKQQKLNQETQEILMKTFDDFYKQESSSMLSILARSRNEIKDSMIELLEEQADFKEELNKVSEGKYNNARKKENSIPLAVYIRRKRETPSSSMNSSVKSNLNTITSSTASLYVKQHPSERIAVEKYMKKRERQKIAESNRINREKSNVEMTVEIDRILSGIQGTEDIKEKERDRQMGLIQAKLKSSKEGTRNEKEVVEEILEAHNDTQMAYEREKKQQEKRFQRLLTSRQSGNSVTPLEEN